MNKLILCSIIAGIIINGCTAKISGSDSSLLFVCGDDKVELVDMAKSNNNNLHITWRWSVSEAKNIPEKYQKLLIPLDECKPVNNNSRLLLTSSGGATILLDVKTRKVLFYAVTPMAHSAALLPRNRVIVANSTHKNGNSIEIYDLNSPEKVIYKDSLYSGHGVVWNPQKSRVYALGYDLLKEYSLQNWETVAPLLKLERSWKLPDIGGHDLSRKDDNSVLITTHNNVWVFDMATEKFSVLEELINKKNVKSVNIKHNKIVYTIAEESWWTHNIYSVNPGKKITIPYIKLYKARFAE